MAVQMIGRDVEDQRDFGFESYHRFELKAGEFQDDRGAGRGLCHQVRDGYADVAADKRGTPGVLEDVADKRGGGGLTIGAGDADDMALQLLRGKFEFAGNASAPGSGAFENRQFQRDAGRLNEQVEAIGIGLELGGLREIGLGGLRAVIGDDNMGAPRAQEFRGGQTGLAAADDKGPFVGEIRHRSLSVVSAKRAMMRPMIQKRMMTFDSGQPRSSKW